MYKPLNYIVNRFFVRHLQQSSATIAYFNNFVNICLVRMDTLHGDSVVYYFT